MGSAANRNTDDAGTESSRAIKRYLTISTNHISRETAYWLSYLADDLLANGGDSSIVHSFTHGWFISVGAFDSHDDTPEDIRAIVNLARMHGCEHILLDVDGPVLAELPTSE